MHLTIAIPTFNRCDYLRKNIEYFDRVQRPDGVKLSLTISNSASEDGTEEFLKHLQEKRDNLHLFNQKTDWTGNNYGYLSATIPADADWVWLMGDDDYIPQSDALVKVCEVLLKNQKNDDFGFVHACQAKRSRPSGNIITNSVLQLCNQFGYTEMLGWISSLVMRRENLVPALKKVDDRAQLARGEPAYENTHSAFFQASYFFEEIHWMQGAFIDLPLVETQDEGMTEETRQRWHAENMGERYIYIMDDLERLKSNGINLGNLSAKFFRYHRYQLWDRFIIHQLGVLEAHGDGDHDAYIESSMSRFIKNWQRISSISSYLDDPLSQKLLTTGVENCLGLCNLYLESNFNPKVKELLSRQRELHSVAVYDFFLAYE